MNKKHINIIKNLNGTFCAFITLGLLSLTIANVNNTDLIIQLTPFLLLAILFICLYSSYVILKEEMLAIWTPVPWFLAACGIYYGFGTLVYFYGNIESVNYADLTYPMDYVSINRVLLLNCVAISCVIAGIIIGSKLPPYPHRFNNSAINVRFMNKLLLMYLIIGIPIKYIIILPAHFGIIDFVVPGSIIFMSSLTSLSIVLLFALDHWTGNRKYRIILYCVVVAELLSSLMMLAKIAVITTAIMILLGRYICRPNIKQLAIGSAVVAVVFIFFLTPFVNYARYAFNVKGIASISEFGSSLNMYSEKEENKLLYSMPGVQAWWLRLNYANVQSFAMDSYDNGLPGNSFGLVYVALIPRFLYPDKPSLQLGSEFHKLLTGFENSQSSPGIFAESYWNGGWLAVVLASMFLGYIFSIYLKFSLNLISENKYGYLPIIFTGMLIGLRPDDWFVSTVILLPFLAMILYLLQKKLFKILGDE